ncbi:hypothetical protein [Aeromicrobium sp. 50.2.37]|uniref:TY-Chap domain-containing protein n=1 Tax=Aeromicrobium sp. 50.2.37 TaxID=2969305 RepID=UPI00214FED78|nr:hypothetical protein [Aeromicrobium sp. 50.2.37]
MSEPTVEESARADATEVVTMDERDGRSIEQGVDAWVEGSWLDFRMRLAEWMLAAPDHNTLVLDPAPHDLEAPTVQVSTTDDARFVALSMPDDAQVTLATPYALSLRTAARLTDLGFVPARPSGEPVLGLDRDDVDRLAHAASTVLHEVWGVVSPAFLSAEVVSPHDDGEILEWEASEHVPAAETADPEPSPGTTEIAWSSSPEEQQALLEEMMQAMVSAPLKVAPDGSIRMRGKGGVVTVRVRDKSLVEVVTVLAREVRFKRAHREADRLSRRFRHVRFFLERDMLLATVPVEASPLVAEHLHDAVNHLLRLRVQLADLDTRLKRRRAKTPEPAQEPVLIPAVDPTLSVLAGDAGDASAEELVEMFREVAPNLETVERWIETAHRESRAALTAGRRADEGLREACIRQWRHWRRVRSALGQVRDDLQHGSSTGHEDAS